MINTINVKTYPYGPAVASETSGRDAIVVYQMAF